MDLDDINTNPHHVSVAWEIAARGKSLGWYVPTGPDDIIHNIFIVTTRRGISWS